MVGVILGGGDSKKQDQSQRACVQLISFAECLVCRCIRAVEGDDTGPFGGPGAAGRLWPLAAGSTGRSAARCTSHTQHVRFNGAGALRLGAKWRP